MSQTRTSWMLEIIDKVSSPLTRITSKVGGAESIFKKTTASVDMLEQKTQSLTDKLGRLSLQAGGFALMTRGSLEFETGMARVNTMAKLGASQLAGLTDEVRDLADDVPKLRTELADGLYKTISAGVPENNMISFLETSARTSVGAIAELNDVVGVTSAVVKNYSMEWNKAADVQDKIQKTVELGDTTFQELATTLPSVTGLSSQLNIGINELLGTFAALTGVSGNTSEVGTQVSAMLSALIKPSSEAAKMAEELNVQFNSMSVSNAGGLEQFLTGLSSKIDKFSAATGRNKEQIIATLFGSSEAVRAFLPITGSVAEDFKNKTGEIANATGTIDTAFDNMNNTTNAKLQRFQNQFGNTIDIVTTATKPLLGGLLAIVGGGLKMIGMFADAHPVLFQTAIVLGAVWFGSVMLSTALQLVVVKTTLLAIRQNALFGSMLRVGRQAAVLAFRFGVGLVRSLALASLAYVRLTLRIYATGLRFLWLSVTMRGYFIGSVRSTIASITGLIAAKTRLIFTSIRLGAIMMLTRLRFMMTSAMLFASFIPALLSATMAQMGLNAVLVANPIGVVIVAIGALVGLVILAVKHWDLLKAKLIQFGQFFLKWSPFGFMFQILENLFPAFMSRMNEVFGSVMKWFSGLWDKIKNVLSSVGKFLGLVSDTEVNVSFDEDNEGGGGLKFDGKGGSSNPVADALLNDNSGGGGSGDAPSLNNSATNGISGGGSGKTLTMNLDIKNIFNVNGDKSFDTNMDLMIDKLMTKINDRMRDASIALG